MFCSLPQVTGPEPGQTPGVSDLLSSAGCKSGSPVQRLTKVSPPVPQFLHGPNSNACLKG